MTHFKNILLLTTLSVFGAAVSFASSDSDTLPTLPSLEQFLENPPDSASTGFNINDQCSATLAKIDTSYTASFDPSDCLNLGVFLDLALPKDKGNFDMGSDFMVLDNIIIRSFSFNTATKEVDIATAYTGTVPIIPGVISISNIMMQITFVSTRSDQWTFDIAATITIGSVVIDVRLNRDERGYYLSASTDAIITATDISSIFQTGDSFLPTTGLETELKNASFDSFGIEALRIKAVFTDGYGFLFGGKIRIMDWEPIDVNLLINKPNDGVLSVTIAVFTPTFELSKVFRDIFKMDISDVPVIGTATIQNLALIISTQDVQVPLALLDIGYRGLFNPPYQQGIKVMFDVNIIDVYVSVSLVITPNQLSLTVSNPSDLTLRKIIVEFMPDASELISSSDGDATLNGWPSFIKFDPLAISLSELAIVAGNEDGSWGVSRADIKLVMTEPIVLFDDVITISDLSFELNWRKTENGTKGVIEGTVTIGSGEIVSPKAEIRIPFPFANEEITFTFTDFSINSTAAALGFTIPQHDIFSFMTRIQLDRIALSFDDRGKLNKISVECSLPVMWPIYGSFSVGNMKASFTMDNLAGKSAERTWEFKLSGHMMISSCDISSSTTIGSELIAVRGEGINCHASIADLLTAIQVNPSDFPSMISGFTLSDPVVAFRYDRTTNGKSFGFGATTNLFGQSDAEIVFVSTGESSAIVAAFGVRSSSSVSEISFLDDLGLTDITVLYVSKSVTLAPYQWRSEIFQKYAPADEQLDKGLTIKAKFTPSPDNMMGRLLTDAGKATIDVSLTLPELLFEIKIVMPDGGIPLGDSGGRFVSMGLVISKRLIGLNVAFNISLPNVTELMFIGELSFTFGGTVTISLLLEGEWDEPFDLKGFAIYRLGLALGINVVTLFPSFGLTGEIKVTPPGRDEIRAGLTLCVDTADPRSTVFEVHFTRFLLADMVNLFLGEDANLPDEVANMGFPDQVHIFLSPGGNDNCFGKRYEAGVEIHGTFQIPFLQVYARADIVIRFDPFQLYADLRLHPINYGDGLLKIVSAESDDAGPYLVMNIGSSSDFLIDGSCKIVLFGASISVRLSINTTHLFFQGELNLWNLFRVSLTVDMSYGDTDPYLRVIGYMQNDLFTKLKTRATQGIRNGARAVNEKIESARAKIRNANREVNRLLDSIRYHERKISEAKRECSRAPWYKKWICIGTAARIVYHGVVIGGIYVAYGVAKGVLAVAEVFLQGVQALIKIAAEVLVTLVNAVLSIIDIKYVKFDVNLTKTQQSFHFESEIVILDWTFYPSFTINFSSSRSAEADINGAGDKISSDTMEKVENPELVTA